MSKIRALSFFGLSLLVFGSGLEYWLPRGIGAERLFDRLNFMKIRQVNFEVEWPLNGERVKHWLPTLEGKNLFFLKAAPLIETLKGKPWVKEITVKKQFPDQLTILVTSIRAHAILVSQGQSFFMDAEGKIIERVDPSLFAGHDLPLITVDKNVEAQEWQIADVLKVLNEIREKLGPSGEVSESRLGTFPTLRLFLTNYKMEIILTLDNWRNQVSELCFLLQKPPMGLGSIRRINLTLAKKAVVSSTLSN